ncbi:hypothetical protein ACCAA_350122 [Candidatus Accumulibacter aalborgensis]|uniref:Uncharacterized protein n=1 Tax=Candidatus Accumulibacter aalborgensis TaxID=1860102 RepID=A0A1A8XNK9_9PROT|nr:hypothetical protein ACCAA_350122 [Candidatus Accumulibacter aalborgensis]
MFVGLIGYSVTVLMLAWSTQLTGQGTRVTLPDVSPNVSPMELESKKANPKIDLSA